jgi:large repetitive protein
MRVRTLAISLFALALVSCAKNNDKAGNPQCSDGIDNDGDGLVDFPDDPGCTSPDDDSEDSPPSPQCSDGRDNDGDGLIDFPNDPGCFSPEADDETDDCPSGPNCPQCGNQIDDDNNGLIDYPADPGCMSAADPLELTDNPEACGPAVTIKQLPPGGHVTGTLMGHSNLMGSCGGTGGEDVYELEVTKPSQLTATTDNPATTIDTVLYVRTVACTDATMELGCNDNALDGTTEGASTLTVSIPTPGVYYLIVDDSMETAGGMYDLQVTLGAGLGTACTMDMDCGTGLVCRIPLNETAMVCSKPECSDGVDDDGDGKADYPDDPGCSSPDDNDETDDCPTGPNCPQCANGKDDDGDGKIDYPADTSCKAASGVSEACNTTEGVVELTNPVTMGNDTHSTADGPTQTCATSAAPDDMYMLVLPPTTTLSIDVEATDSSFQAASLYNSTCGGTAIQCEEDTPITLTNHAGGTFYLSVAGDEPDEVGAYSITISGTIGTGKSCESPLVASGAINCATGFACKGTVGSRTCQVALCSDGIDNDGDGKTDYPNDPGCTSPNDDDETDPATPPVCSDTLDNDADGKTDWPADYGCQSAAGTSEIFCVGEQDPTSLITTKTTNGNTTGLHNDITPSCGFSDAPDQVFALQLPVEVASLQLDTAGSTLDTVISFRDAQCDTEVACNDDTGAVTTSQINETNFPPGGYAISVEGYTDGAFKLNVRGTVATGTSCTSALFTGGANAVLVCPAATTCKGTPKKCQ